MPRTKGTPSEVKKTARQFKKRSKTKIKPKKAVVWTRDRFIPTGSTMLNLAISDKVYGGWPLGRISTLPGASSAGKTFLILTTLACCCQDPRFDDYHLVYDDVEHRMDFDIGYLFGKTLKKRMEKPPLGYSNTIQDVQHNLTTLVKSGEPFIYILDSFDSLSSDEEIEKEMRKALAAAKDPDAVKKIAGSYNTEKAKIAGQILRSVKAKLSGTDSSFIIVQQLRQNLNAGAWGEKYGTSGGEAPFFYSHVRPHLTKLATLKSKGRKIGVTTKADLKKNSVTGKLRDVTFNIFYDHPGLDDIGSMVDFLVDEKHWKKTKNTIKATDLGIEGTRSVLIRQIEEDDLVDDLKEVVQWIWTDIENSLKQHRKPRFS